MIYTTLSNFLLSRKICATSNDLYSTERFVLRWMFGMRSIICTTLNHLGYDELLSIGFLINTRCTYSKKYCKIFYTNLWVDFFLIWKYQEEIFSAQPLKLVIKRCWSYGKLTQKTWRMNWHVAAMISYICFLFLLLGVSG